MNDTQQNERSLRSIEDIRPIYFLPNDPFAEEVLIPAFREAEKACCMMGFFSSQSLSDLAPGLATYINTSQNSIKLIVSPFLRKDDVEAIENGLRSVELERF